MVLLVVGKTEAMQPSSSEAKGKTPINFTERDLFLWESDRLSYSNTYFFVR